MKMVWYLKIAKVLKLIVAMELLMVKPLALYFIFTSFNPDMVSYFPMILNAWTDLKSICLDFVCRKGLPSTKEIIWLAPHFGGVIP